MGLLEYSMSTNEADAIGVRAGKSVVDVECYEGALRQFKASRATPPSEGIDDGSASLAALWQQLAAGPARAMANGSSVEENED